MVPQLMSPMVPQLKNLMVPQPMMTMVLKVPLITTMLMRVQLLTPMVLQLMMPMVPQLVRNMVPQLIILMFLPQNTATLPDVDVPDLATLADQPQLGLTETETDQLPEDQLLKLQELADSSGQQLLRPPEDKLLA